MTQISIRAMAQMAGVSHGSIGGALASAQTEDCSKLADFLLRKGFSKQELASVATEGVAFLLQTAILEYYAFHAGRYCSDKANKSLAELKGDVYIPRKIRKENKMPERKRQHRLQKIVGGDMEVLTQVGRIDILTETEVIEVKKVADWKSAIGQVIAYGYFYPSHKLRVNLFGTIEASCLELITEIAAKQNIKVTWEP